MEYAEKIRICGPYQNSYSKTDHDATFMRMKKDYMGNDQLLPAYNIQIGVSDEYIAVVDVMQYRSDMDCFVPLMEKFHEIHGFYPKYPVADAGYGSFNNYLFCQEHGMEKFMKFPCTRRRQKTRNITMRKPVKGNQYGRQEEYYTCEDCSGCPYAEKCKNTEKKGALLRMNRSNPGRRNIWDHQI